MEAFLTTDKDILRKICRMPQSDFLISDPGQLDETDANPFDDQEDLADDDWVLVKPEP